MVQSLRQQFFDAETRIVHGKKKRERFHLPYPNFLQLVVSVSESELFDRWCGHKWNNKQASPIELLVLGSLRYLGRGWTFDDVEENTAISKDSILFERNQIVWPKSKHR